jgi:hypothetical protein
MDAERELEKTAAMMPLRRDGLFEQPLSDAGARRRRRRAAVVMDMVGEGYAGESATEQRRGGGVRADGHASCLRM